MNTTTPIPELASTAYNVYYKDEVDALLIVVRDMAAEDPLEADETIWDLFRPILEDDIRDLLKNRNEETLWPDIIELNEQGQEDIILRFLDNYHAMYQLATGITNHIRENNPGLSL